MSFEDRFKREKTQTDPDKTKTGLKSGAKIITRRPGVISHTRFEWKKENFFSRFRNYFKDLSRKIIEKLEGDEDSESSVLKSEPISEKSSSGCPTPPNIVMEKVTSPVFSFEACELRLTGKKSFMDSSHIANFAPVLKDGTVTNMYFSIEKGCFPTEEEIAKNSPFLFRGCYGYCYGLKESRAAYLQDMRNLKKRSDENFIFHYLDRELSGDPCLLRKDLKQFEELRECYNIMKVHEEAVNKDTALKSLFKSIQSFIDLYDSLQCNIELYKNLYYGKITEIKEKLMAQDSKLAENYEFSRSENIFYGFDPLEEKVKAIRSELKKVISGLQYKRGIFPSKESHTAFLETLNTGLCAFRSIINTFKDWHIFRDGESAYSGNIEPIEFAGCECLYQEISIDSKGERSERGFHCCLDGKESNGLCHLNAVMPQDFCKYKDKK